MSRRSEYTDRFRTDVAYRPRQSTGYGEPSRDGSSTLTVPQILALVDRATNIDRRSPDYALNLQIADYINEKKGTAPREVAMKLAKLAYPSYGRRGILALSVLDVCVKNCGYPFHLAISRRDFLNTLVRPFGVNPPLHYSHLQNVILGMLQEWDLGLVKHSKYRDDLTNISDMNRLLQRKGYIFPEVSQEDVAALRPMEDALKSAAELENEDREVQSAKLQELIRSGTPEDLKEANRLMSLMAGFRESRIDYHAKMAAELDKVRRKAELFGELLDQADPETLNGDVLVDLHQSLKAAVPKIKHILNDKETMEEDEAAHQKVLDLQNLVDLVIRKYGALKQGDPGAASMTTSSSAKLDSLIDIGDDDSSKPSAVPSQGSSGDDLLGLSLGGLSLGSSTSTSHPVSTADILQLGATSSKSPVASPYPQSSVPSPSPSASTSASIVDPFSEFTAPQSTAAPSFVSPPPQASSVSVHSDGTIAVSYTATKQEGRTEIVFHISNPGSKKITNLETQFAPPKSLKLELGPLPASQIEARQTEPLNQKIALIGPSAAPKLRWKINYNFGVEQKTIGGDIKSI